jgi:Curli production assembly/transport component CsgG
MKNVLFLGLVFFTFTVHAQYEAQIKGIVQVLSEKVIENRVQRIAVADFTDLEGRITKLGLFISEELNTFLPEAGFRNVSWGGFDRFGQKVRRFEVIDRSRISLLMRENKLNSTGLTDPDNAVKLGKLAGIEALVYGSIIPFGKKSVRVNIKILDLQRGVILGSWAGNIIRTDDIDRLLSETTSSNSH